MGLTPTPNPLWALRYATEVPLSPAKAFDAWEATITRTLAAMRRFTLVLWSPYEITGHEVWRSLG